ncbi:MAG: NAD(P)H-binding protein [Candidatus Binataceae bacterium]|nr:NAD(P)H-binding protein [Candidatus Binataceae bacterium]
MASNDMIVAIAGGSGFIGAAIARRLAHAGHLVRILTRNPDRVRDRFDFPNVDLFRADVTDPSSLRIPLAGAHAIIDTVQFDGYPVENHRRGLTFERIDFGGTNALLDACDDQRIQRFIYVSGAAADAYSPHPGFRAKGNAERSIRNSGLPFTIFRPSLVYGPGDRVLTMFARILKLSPVFVMPGSGQQKLQPVLVNDLAQCVELALGGRGLNGSFEIGGPDPLTFDALIKLMMEVTKRHRAVVHAPAALMNITGAIAESLPHPIFSRDAATFVLADSLCDNSALLAEFGITLTPASIGLRYLAEGS